MIEFFLSLNLQHIIIENIQQITAIIKRMWANSFDIMMCMCYVAEQSTDASMLTS